MLSFQMFLVLGVLLDLLLGPLFKARVNTKILSLPPSVTGIQKLIHVKEMKLQKIYKKAQRLKYLLRNVKNLTLRVSSSWLLDALISYFQNSISVFLLMPSLCSSLINLSNFLETSTKKSLFYYILIHFNISIFIGNRTRWPEILTNIKHLLYQWHNKSYVLSFHLLLRSLKHRSFHHSHYITN